MGITHARKTAFPLPFASDRIISGGSQNSTYVIGAMFTRAYADKAARLAASCEKFTLPYEFHEVPAVHRSISSHGADDLSLTKANFIHFLLSKHRKPVLYVDADCEFVSQPVLLDELVRSRCDFVIYNWLADECTDWFRPIEIPSVAGSGATNRYFKYQGNVGLFSTTQLICSGAVQFYRNSRPARAMLAAWQRTIASFKGSADDQCLDFTYNNLTRRSWAYWTLKARWLPKAYARVAFWIYAEPVINHPDFPAPVTDFVPIKDPRGRKRFYPSLTERRATPGPFPRDCILDVEERMMCRLDDNRLVPIAPIEQAFWIDRSSAWRKPN